MRSSQSLRGLVLGIAALSAALASDAIDLGGSDYIDVNGGSGAWTALGLVIVGSLAAVGGTIAAVVSWIGALLNTWQLEDKMWFGLLLAGATRLGRRRDDRLRRRRPRRQKAERGTPRDAGLPARENRGKSSSPNASCLVEEPAVGGGR